MLFRSVLSAMMVGQAAAIKYEQLAGSPGWITDAWCNRFLPPQITRAYNIAAGQLGWRGVTLGAAGAAPTQPPPAWRVSRAQNGGGILVNWSPSDLDYLLSICGWTLKPRAAYAVTWPIAPHLSARVDPASDAENHYLALVSCDGGAVIHAERGEFTSIRTENAWQIIGSRASLRLHMTTTDAKQIWLDEADADKGVTSRLFWEGNEDAALVPNGAVQDFAEAILHGRPPATDLAQALAVERIFDAIYASAASGRVAPIA